MAKSIRSKSKLGSRNVKRYNPKSDYAVVQAARLHQTASRLASKNKHGKTVAEEEADQVEGIEGDEKMLEEEQGAAKAGDTAAADANVDSLDGEAGGDKKVSTSGTREARRETWRAAKGWKPRKGSKNGGRPKRRK